MSRSSEVLLVLGAGLGQVLMILAALEAGLEVVAVDPTKDAPGLKIARHSCRYDLADKKVILQLARCHGIAGVTTLGADYPMPLLARVAAVRARDGRLGLPTIPPECRSNYHMFYVLTTDIEERSALIEHLKAAGIQAVCHYVPLHSSVVGARLETASARFPVTDRVSPGLGCPCSTI